MIRMTPALACAALVATPLMAQMQNWKLDPAHSAAQFSVRHLGISTVRGAFTKMTGAVQYDPLDVTKSSVDVTIDTASVDTRVERRDNDLRSDHFLDANKYPTLTFHSKRVEAAGPGKLKITGDLTLHGVTKQVVLDVDGPSASIKDQRGMMHMGASATTTINRTDFGVDGAPGAVGNDIALTLDVEMVKTPAEATK
ncbi:MAG TPA: YceI family protein [Bryobacteraceae bacterium]|jgi:polyisoprenoid-binding protein YceI|nr:YceI family protein [Bryobacteraceae bacterium]